MEEYSDSQFGHELLSQMAAGYDPARLAKWAESTFYSGRKYSPAVRKALINLFTMLEGDEFHSPQAGVIGIALQFIGDDVDPDQHSGG